jgi:glucose/mannose-6-phosphate isomerase
MSDRLSAQAVAAVDKSDLLADILSIGDHISDAMWRAESAFLQPTTSRSLVICGMGGSAIGADLATAVIGLDAAGPVVVNRSYDLPRWVGGDDAVVLSSYSGSTEETLACFEQAKASGAKLYVVSSGGLLSEAAHADGIPVIGLPGIFQPRAAVAYGIVSVIEIAIANGLAPASIRSDLKSAAESVTARAAELAPDGSDAIAKSLAESAIDGNNLPLITGADLTAAIAYRWRCQINENAKYPAMSSELPEANHNEICSWDGAQHVHGTVVWYLTDSDQNPRVAERIAATTQIVAPFATAVETISAGGGSRAERLFSLVLLGDVVSLYMGVLRGVDPTPVDPIEDLKDRLGRPTGTA